MHHQWNSADKWKFMTLWWRRMTTRATILLRNYLSMSKAKYRMELRHFFLSLLSCSIDVAFLLLVQLRCNWSVSMHLLVVQLRCTKCQCTIVLAINMTFSYVGSDQSDISVLLQWLIDISAFSLMVLIARSYARQMTSIQQFQQFQQFQHFQQFQQFQQWLIDISAISANRVICWNCWIIKGVLLKCQSVIDETWKTKLNANVDG